MILSLNDAPRVFHRNANISLGEDVLLSPWVVMDASGGKIEIGDEVELEPGVIIRTWNKGEQGSVKIGNNCTIGAYSVIEPNSDIPEDTLLEPYTHWHPDED